jgi:hypothetical protein
MATFPTSPVDNELATIAGILYIYDSTNGSWTKVGAGDGVASTILNGTSNVSIVGSGANVTVGVSGIANAMVIASDSFYVGTVRNNTANIGNIITYDPTSKEITYGNQLTVQLYLTSIYF